MYLQQLNLAFYQPTTVVAKRGFHKLGEIFLYANKIVSPGINCKLKFLSDVQSQGQIYVAFNLYGMWNVI